MNLKVIFTAMAAGLLAASAYAQSDAATAPPADNAGVSQATAGPLPSDRAISGEHWGITPQYGAMSAVSATNGTISRATYGLTVDYNAMKGSTNAPRLYLGPTVGFLYSQIGLQNADFSGGGGTGAGSTGDYATQVPVNLKIGYDVGLNTRLSVHGGANACYRSNTAALDFGVDQTSSTAWNVFPNVGADAEFGLGSSIGLLARPDWTFTSAGNTIFTGTIGLLISMK